MIGSGPSFLGFKYSNLDITANVAIGGTGTATLTPPTGECYRVVSIYLIGDPPGGGSSGTHEFEAIIDKGTLNIQELLIKSAFNGYPQLKYNSYGGATSESPTAVQEQVATSMQRGIWVTKDHPLTIDYNNDTDAIQTGDEVVRVGYEVYKSVL